MDKSDYVRQLKQRHSSTAWWARTIKDHPMGIVPVPTAARILGVSATRIHALIKEGRLSVIDDMPGGNNRDRFIPFDQLLDAPFAMTRGRPGVFGPKNRENVKNRNEKRDRINSYCDKRLREMAAI